MGPRPGSCNSSGIVLRLGPLSQGKSQRAVTGRSRDRGPPRLPISLELSNPMTPVPLGTSRLLHTPPPLSLASSWPL